MRRLPRGLHTCYTPAMQTASDCCPRLLNGPQQSGIVFGDPALTSILITQSRACLLLHLAGRRCCDHDKARRLHNSSLMMLCCKHREGRILIISILRPDLFLSIATSVSKVPLSSTGPTTVMVPTGSSLPCRGLAFQQTYEPASLRPHTGTTLRQIH